MDNDELLTPEQVAVYLQVSLATLARWRRQAPSLPFVRAGFQIRYRRADVEAWIAGKPTQSGNA